MPSFVTESVASIRKNRRLAQMKSHRFTLKTLQQLMTDFFTIIQEINF
jgi:hypothetical protein